LLFPGDPLDPDDGDCWASILELPAAPKDLWSPTKPGVRPGSLTSLRFDSPVLGHEVPLTLYLPPGVPADDLPVLVVFDGNLAHTVLRVPTVLDNLIAARRIPPTAALLVHNFDRRRTQDLTPGPRLATFVADELLPWAQIAARVGSPGRNLVAGMSYGGLAATYLGLSRPDVFSGVISHSGSYWWPMPADGEPGRLIRDLARYPSSPVRFYLDVGILETQSVAAGVPSQVDLCRAMRDGLRSQGRKVTYAEYTGAHDYINWRRTFPEGLQAVTAG
jgi:enterochelin esterase-like enzyme